MMREEIDHALREIFADMFGRPGGSFTYQTSPDTLMDWDSMTHIRLMAALEERFDMIIPPEEQVDMLNFELIGDVIADLRRDLGSHGAVSERP